MSHYCEECGLVFAEGSLVCPFCGQPTLEDTRSVAELSQVGYDVYGAAGTGDGTDTSSATNRILDGFDNAMDIRVSSDDDDPIKRLRKAYDREHGSGAGSTGQTPGRPPVNPSPSAPSSHGTATSGGYDFYTMVTSGGIATADDHTRPTVPIQTVTPPQTTISTSSEQDDLDQLMREAESQRRRIDQQIARESQRQAWRDFWMRHPNLIGNVCRAILFIFAAIIVWGIVVFLFENLITIISYVIVIAILIAIIRALIGI